MTLKQRIAKMVEQYSITQDNPTVLRELLKLAAIVDALIASGEDVEKKLKELETEIADLDPAKVEELINAMQESVNTAVEKATAAQTEAEEAKQGLASKQDTLTFDETPTTGSLNPVTSDGIRKAIDAIPSTGTVTLDDTVTADSENGVKSSGIYTAIETAKTELNTAISTASIMAYEANEKANEAVAGLAGKQNTLTFDTTPTTGSLNPVTSDGIRQAIDAIPVPETITLDDTVTAASQNAVKSSGIYTAINGVKEPLEQSISNMDKTVKAQGDSIEGLQTFQQTQEETNKTHNDQIATNIQSIQDIAADVSALEADKMDKMTVDQNPTQNSQNLVTSGGVFAAVELAGGIKTVKLETINIKFTKSGTKYVTDPLPEDFIPLFLNVYLIDEEVFSNRFFSQAVLPICISGSTSGSPDSYINNIMLYVKLESTSSYAYQYLINNDNRLTMSADRRIETIGLYASRVNVNAAAMTIPDTYDPIYFVPDIDSVQGGQDTITGIRFS